MYFISPVDYVNFFCISCQNNSFFCCTVRTANYAHSCSRIQCTITQGTVVDSTIIECVITWHFQFLVFCTSCKQDSFCSVSIAIVVMNCKTIAVLFNFFGFSIFQCNKFFVIQSMFLQFVCELFSGASYNSRPVLNQVCQYQSSAVNFPKDKCFHFQPASIHCSSVSNTARAD